MEDNLLDKVRKVNDLELKNRQLEEDLDLVRANYRHYKHEAEKAVKENADLTKVIESDSHFIKTLDKLNNQLTAQLETKEKDLLELEKEIILRDYNASRHVNEDDKKVIKQQQQRILALEWLVENTASEAMNDKVFSLRNQDYLTLAQEVINEYPMYRVYAEPFKEELRKILNKFVIEKVRA